MISILEPNINNDMILENNFFQVSGQQNATSNAIYMFNPTISQYNIRIAACNFQLANSSGGVYGVRMIGSFAPSSRINIEASDFKVSPFVFNNAATGIYLETGDKHNTKIVANKFEGGGTHIRLRHSEGFGNEVIDNDFYASTNFAVAVGLSGFQNTRICNNRTHSSSSVAYFFMVSVSILILEKILIMQEVLHYILNINLKWVIRQK